MIQRALGVIAGVDRKTLSTCPASDKLWAAHLGASLCLSFIVVLGVSYHATGYMIASVWTRLLVSGVIALTVLMFDRALCQSDWFYQGTLWNTAPIQSSAEARQTAWRFVRVGIRLLMSFGLAWVIAMFLELAIFSGTINEKIEADRVAANQPIYAKIAQYEAGLNAESARRQAGIDALQALHRDALTETPAAEPNLQTRNDDIEQQIKALVAREADIRADIGEIDRTIQRYIADMNAEEFGLKAAPNNSGRPGAGPRYEFAKKQKDSFIAQRAAREAEIVQLHAKRDELRAEQSKIAAEALAARDQERSVIKSKADALQARIDAARADLKSFEADKVASIAEFRSKALAESYYQEKKDRVDPLTRIAAYQELKNDPKDGATMTLFSWMTRMFIIFLEIVPVIAKIFFSPPSVYAAKIQAQVERARQRIENNEDLDDDKPTEPAKPAAPAIAAIALPAMSLGAVEMNQPEPRRTERRHTAADDRIDRARSRDGARYDYARDTGDRDVRRHRFEGDIHRRDYAARDYARDDDRRSYAQDVHDDDRRGWHRRDFDRRDVHRRDYRDRDETMPRHEMPRHEVARHEGAQHDVANRRPAQVVARDLAAHGFEAADFFRPDHDDRAFDASELDVRNLIMPRRGAVRREAMPHDVARESFGVRAAAPVVAEVTAEHPAPPAAAASDDRQTRELVRQILVEADAPVIETPVREELPPMPPREPDAARAVSSIRTAAEAEATTESPLPADQTAAQDVTDDVLAESKPAETAEAISPIAADPEPTSDSLGSASPQSPAAAPLIETATPPAAMSQDAAVAPGDAHHGSAGSPALKFSADVERLMSEAVELSKARKKAARARRDHPVAAEAELPLEPAPQYGDVPKA
ncbi:conserved hypothetical protein [Rhodopseudomonas palustris HaA2]|uniref:DUF4407 domain-containing protein n=1 Tax=Rhodopseudomonas palustris (strain HaA2) TaxID=316058 RepID=Q2IVA1_RHOP2|nr:DUF4407 domain-containing protein [Rhodopseudomonas palustris]ABD07859.1 conserved hypothetical protein [Rhodopseudomonas palustris HaA2]